MSEEIQEIRSLISSDNKFKKSSGYSSLLQFQQHSCINASSLQSLAHSAQSIISSIVSDIFDDHDEEIATQALKCLGFMLYHPSIVSVLRVLSTLPKLITTTKLKASLMFFLLLISEKASAMRTSMERSQTITDDVVSIVGSFDHRLSALETAMQALSIQGLISSSGGGSTAGGDGGSSGASRAVVKDKFKTFNTMFEELHQKQSQGTIPDSNLRESLILAVAEVLLPAYKIMLERFGETFSWHVLER
ncbi:hypothetical protein VNO80_09253 [Phaseolus coccineus]|uniref:Exocyst subunit Exo70 family protein n=1 Tax=Phaseolus coccineus TaxID=3886 RepID=A0AAN9N5V3_PHACN